jgi:hypothetical protein
MSIVDVDADRIEGRPGKDPLRRVVLGVLALYLAPAMLIVLLVSLLGMACCTLVRLTTRGRRREDGVPARRDSAARGIPTPHVIETVRSRSPRH